MKRPVLLIASFIFSVASFVPHVFADTANVTITTTTTTACQPEKILSLSDSVVNQATELRSLLQQQVIQCQNEITTLTKKVEDLKGQLSTAKEINATLTTKLGDESSKNVALEGEKANLQKTITDLTKALEEKISERDKALTYSAKLTSDLNGATLKINDLNAKDLSSQAVIDNLTKNLAALQAAKDAELSMKDSTINGLKADLGSADLRIKDMNAKDISNQAAIDNLTKNLAALQAAKDAELSMKDSTINGLKADLDVRDTTIKSLTDDITKLRKTLATLENEKVLLDGQAAKLTNDLNSALKAGAEKDAINATLEKDLAAKELAIQDLINANNKLKSDTEQLIKCSEGLRQENRNLRVGLDKVKMLTAQLTTELEKLDAVPAGCNSPVPLAIVEPVAAVAPIIPAVPPVAVVAPIVPAAEPAAVAPTSDIPVVTEPTVAPAPGAKTLEPNASVTTETDKKPFSDANGWWLALPMIVFSLFVLSR